MTTDHPLFTPIVVYGCTGHKKKFNGIEGRTETHLRNVHIPENKVTVRLNHDDHYRGLIDLPRENVFVIVRNESENSSTHKNQISDGEVNR